MSSAQCPNCQNELQGQFCQDCGERAMNPKDKRFLHFAEEAFSSLFIANGKFPRTLRQLITKPGELTRSYISGVRRQYISPVQLFFFANLIYFLFPVISTFNTSLYIQMNQLPYSSHVKTVVEDHLEESGVQYDEFREAYEKKSTSNGKLLLIILVILNGILLKLLFIRREEFYFLDFLTASAYFYSFYILIVLVALPLLFTAASEVFSFGLLSRISETLLSVSFLIILSSYLFFQIRRAFNASVGSALWKSLVLGILMIPSFIIYRYILFWVTYVMVK